MNALRRTLHDLGRLREIGALDLCADDVAEELQDLAEEAAERLGQPIGLVTVVLDEAQFLAGAHGLAGAAAEVGGTPVEWSYCQHTVHRREPFVVEDALEDEVARDLPATRLLGVRAYLGIPLVTSRDQAVGTVCVLSGEPTAFDEADVRVLEELAAIAVGRMEARRGVAA